VKNIFNWHSKAGCPSVFSQRDKGHVLFQDTPKFKAISKKKGLKCGRLRILRETIYKNRKCSGKAS
jgi:hypothetical protein